MAQWLGQYSGRTHETNVQEAEESLRKAVEIFKAAPESEKAAKAVRHLAERLLACRLKALRARLFRLKEPGLQVRDNGSTDGLHTQEAKLRDEGVDGILKEFWVFIECDQLFQKRF